MESEGRPLSLHRLISLHRLQEILTVNVTAAAELTRLLLPAMRRSRGHVSFVYASLGMRAVARWAAFVGSKDALRDLVDSLRFQETGDRDAGHRSGALTTTVTAPSPPTEASRATTAPGSVPSHSAVQRRVAELSLRPGAALTTGTPRT